MTPGSRSVAEKYLRAAPTYKQTCLVSGDFSRKNVGPDKFILMLRAFHEGMQAQLMIDGEMTHAFPVAHEVKQGCFLTPTLFTLNSVGFRKLQCSKFQIVTPSKAFT